MTRHLVEAGHTVTVASRSRGADRRGRRSSARVDGGDPAGVVAASEITILCVPNSPRGRRGRRRHARRARHADSIVVDTLDDRPRRRAGPARTGHRRRRRATSRRRSRAAPSAPRRARSPSWSAATRPRSTRRGPRSTPFAGLIVHVGGPGHGPGGEALQQPDLRGADARDRGGDRAGRTVGRRPRPSCTRCSPMRPATAWRCAPACRSRASIPDSPASNGWKPGLHDRPHGEGRRPRARLRGRRGRAAGDDRAGRARCWPRRRPPATGARTSPRWPRCSSTPPRTARRTSGSERRPGTCCRIRRPTLDDGLGVTRRRPRPLSSRLPAGCASLRSPDARRPRRGSGRRRVRGRCAPTRSPSAGSSRSRARCGCRPAPLAGSG